VSISSARRTAVDVFAVVRDALAVVLELDPALIGADSSLRELGADSLARVEMAEIVEAQLTPVADRPLSIPDADLGTVETVAEAVDLVAAQL